MKRPPRKATDKGIPEEERLWLRVAKRSKKQNTTVKDGKISENIIATLNNKNKPLVALRAWGYQERRRRN